jgi:hypothetical protein
MRRAGAPGPEAAHASLTPFGARHEAVHGRCRDPGGHRVGGRSGLVLVTGDTGYGMTTLVEVFARMTAWGGALVARTRCNPAERLLPTGYHRGNGETNIARATRRANRRPHDLIDAVTRSYPTTQ